MTATLAIRLPEDLNKRLEEISRRTGRTKTDYVREAILEHLEDMEDAHLAAERLNKHEPIYTMEEVEERFGLLDD
jgi:RHH-type rel operon transcriptional repressor/antitoxin RelB